MNRTYVALDLETTGLDPESDRIIEIGAVKFCNGETIESFHSLVNPHRPISNRVRLLTGIDDADLKQAPDFEEVAGQLAAFMAGCPIVGQNIQFDLSFLQEQGIVPTGQVLDTFDMASILFPCLPDYSLAALAERFQVHSPVHHRALEDAVTTRDVFLVLLKTISGLGLPLLAEMNKLSANPDWSWRPLLLQAENATMLGSGLWDASNWEEDLLPQPVEPARKRRQAGSGPVKPVDFQRLHSLFDSEGPIAKSFPGFEYRPGQVSMMQEVVRAFNNGEHVIVEAGTGVGKSIAYLLPALYHAYENDAGVVISTNTINLQEQLTGKDLPGLLTMLDSRMAAELDITQLKGRSNYLCRRRWHAWRRVPNLPWEEARFLLRILLWLTGPTAGDRAELSLYPGEFPLWARICAADDNCVTERCPHYPGNCFLYRARHRAEGAHLVLVNHALLMSDFIGPGRILPEYHYLIVDEAHHLQEEATEQLGYRVGNRELDDVLRPFQGSLLAHIRSHQKGASISGSGRSGIQQKVEGLVAQAGEAGTRSITFLTNLGTLVRQMAGQPLNYSVSVRLTKEVRSHSGWGSVTATWESLDGSLSSLAHGLDEIHDLLEDLPGGWTPEPGGALAEICSLRKQINGIRLRLTDAINSANEDNIYWASLGTLGDTTVHAAPLHVGRLLQENLFSQKASVVLASATLTVGGKFEYVKDSLGFTDAAELVVDASFDYVGSTLIYLPEDFPEPDRPNYRSSLEESLVEVCKAARGRTLALFTSHNALRAAYAAIQPRLEREGILMFGQGVDGSPKRVLGNFRSNPTSLLLGASALWEGVDVVGQGLSVVIITRLPFAVPSDPIHRARSELFTDPFSQYLVPQAILKFKQGFGRLIRSRTDRGVVIILDKRIQSKSYGRLFLDSLPHCTVRRGKLMQLPHDVADWLQDCSPPKESPS